MKMMRKKISLILTVLIIIVSLSGCGSQNTIKYRNGKTTGYIREVMIETFQVDLDADELKQVIDLINAIDFDNATVINESYAGEIPILHITIAEKEYSIHTYNYRTVCFNGTMYSFEEDQESIKSLSKFLNDPIEKCINERMKVYRSD